jgi:acyl transferase domain-containing protein
VENYELAIIGMAGRFSGADTLDQFWENLRSGVESITRFTDEELIARGVDPAALRAPNFVKAGASPSHTDLFAASFFGFAPREAELMDPQHRVFLECAWEALERSGYYPDAFPGLIGVYAGTSLSSYLLFNLLENSDLRAAKDTFPLMIGNDKDFLSTRVSYHLNLRGPSLDIQTGCSTSLVALHLACEGLLSCQCDIALVGGVSINVPQKTGYYYQAGGVTSPDGHCRAFDARAQGTIFGSGVGVVALRRLEDALANGDIIHAVVKGSAINNDGAAKVGYTAPSVEGQAEVIARAQAIAGTHPDTISYVETHGTATTLGDAVEMQALTKAFRAHTQERGFCAIGSVKTNIGHLDAAAGIAGLIKTVLALKHRQLPPTLHFTEPNPQIDFANSPFYVNARLSEWNAGSKPRRAGVSSFGIGGTNAHVVLEEAPEISPSAAADPWQILPLSAKSPAALDAMIINLAEHLGQFPQQNIADVAYTLQLGRKPFTHRCSLVCTDSEDAQHALASRSPERLLRGAPQIENRSVAFMFPGQGSQRARMAQNLYEHEPVFREQINRCCLLLTPHLGLDLRTLLYPSDAGLQAAQQQLGETALAQPALFVTAYALAQMWVSRGVRPEVMIGHSIGEYVAACVAGVFSIEDALALVASRGRMMQQLPKGAMLAVALSEQDVLPLLNGERLSLAAINGHLQCVVSGPVDAIQEFEQLLTAREIEHHRLATSHAFHSSMMDAVTEPFAREVGRFRLEPPNIPFVSNVTGTWITAEQATDPRYWVQHLRDTVRFDDGLKALLAEPNWVLLEVGPGQTLSSLARRHPDKQERQTVLSSLQFSGGQPSDMTFARTTLGRLWLAGVNVDWASLHTDARRRVNLPTYPFERQRYWIDPQQRSASAVSKQADTAERKADSADWFYMPSWKRAPTLQSCFMEKAIEEPPLWLVLDDRSTLAAGILQGLERLGHPTIRVVAGAQFTAHGDDEFEVAPGESDDYEQLIKALADKNRFPDCILHLWNSRPGDSRQPATERFAEAQAKGFYSLLYLAQAVTRQRAKRLHIWTVAAQLQDITGEEELSPENATMLGLCDVLPQEFSQIACHSIDIVPDAPETPLERHLIEQIVNELTNPEPATSVAFRHQHRWIQTFERLRLEETSPAALSPLRRGGVYLIIGGLGAIGLSLAEHLAKVCEARLVLVGRSPFPARDEWESWLERHGEEDGVSRTIQRLRAIEALGASVLLANADIADQARMREVLVQAQAHFGTLHGVIHAAGHAGKSAFKLIPELDRAECQLNFRSKVDGLYVLSDVLGQQALDFCLLFSSNASVLGGPGLAGYAAAHRFMDVFAQSRNRLWKTPWLSVNWDSWLPQNGDSAEQTLATRIDNYALTHEAGTVALQRILTHVASGQVVVSSGDLNARRDIWIGRQPAAPIEEGAARTLHPRPSLDISYVPPQNHEEQIIIEIWQELLGIEQIGVHDNFFDLGGNSLIGGKVIARLNEALKVDLPIVKLFERPTVSSLAKFITSEHEQRPVYEQRQSRGERRRERRQSRGGQAIEHA